MFKKSIIITTIVFTAIFFINNLTYAGDIKITKPNYLASTSKDALSKAIEYSVVQDYVALQEVIDSGLIFSLNAGIEVYVVERGFFSGLIKIRPVGHTVEVWTLIEAVSK